ncbi:unnamed protein product [Lupinus luteus]|uniref:Uncharacterized protein n=1 Tax=Lupinus luteus TaxID=3873 RepID=A0AAV1XM10_LUPLU
MKVEHPSSLSNLGAQFKLESRTEHIDEAEARRLAHQADRVGEALGTPGVKAFDASGKALGGKALGAPGDKAFGAPGKALGAPGKAQALGAPGKALFTAR